MATMIRLRLTALFMVFVTLVSACNYPAQALTTPTAAPTTAPSLTPTPAATAVPPSPTPQPATATPQLSSATPTFTPTIPPTLTPTPTPTPVPQCTILKDLSLFPGPGTAYLLQLAVLRAGTTVTPSGYDPGGYPSAPWVQVTDPASQQQGWIIATSDYVNCSLDLTTLPAVTVTPPAPACRTLVNATLRPGPGTDYWNNLVSLPLNTLLTASYYYPSGIPTGSWAYVKDPTGQKKGWVDASTSSIECNFNVSSLPSTTIDPPPYPHPTFSSVTSNCDKGKVFTCSVSISDAYLLQIKIFKSTKEIGFSEGVDLVVFTVKDMTDNKTLIYNVHNSPYCIFNSSGGSCNPWLLKGYGYKWPTYGDPLDTTHAYKILIKVYSTITGLDLSWEGVVNFNVP